MKKQEETFYNLLTRLWLHISIVRKTQLAFLLLLIIITSLSEVFSIGAVLPFLAVLSSPKLLFDNNYAKPFIDILNIKNADELLMPLTILFVVAIIISGILRIILLWAQTRISFAIGSDLSFKVYRKTLFQPYEVHLSRNSSVVISGILSKTTGVINNTLMPITTIISSLIMLFIILFALLAINSAIALSAILGIGMFYVIIIKITKSKLTNYSKVINIESNNVVKALQEGLGGIRDVLIDGTQETYCEVYRKADLPTRRSQANINIIGGIPRYAIEAIGMLLIAVLAFQLAKSSTNFSVAVPILGSLALGAQRMLPVLQQLFVSWTTLTGSKSSLIDSIELLDQPLPEFLNAKYVPIIFQNKIHLKNISFRYSEDSPWVLKELNLIINKGSKIGFMGTTGGGKSTLLDILMNLINPTVGQIFIDDNILSSNNSRAWQAHIAHVPQAIFLSDSTIAENIAFGIPKNQIDYNLVYEAAKKAQIADIIESWETKYNTIVGERGIKLSGGQRQRIGIARALYKKADVLIFDEATSALDNDTETEVMKAINKLDSHLTIIMVAHRLSTLTNCDFVYEIVNNNIRRYK
jgi:ABC-type multidrug transport system fused ATPase/permease subunit